MSELDELLCSGNFSAFPEKTSRLSAEIARLMREGGAEGRKKAQDLLRQVAANGTNVSSQVASKGGHP